MTIIITGANRGLGFEAARALAADTNRTIVLTGRDLSGLEQAANKLKAITGNNKLVPLRVDLAALDSIRAFCISFRELVLPPLDTIICNAGVSLPTARRRSPDGYEETFAVNHLGHFLLVNLLIDSLQTPARILFVSSGLQNLEQTRGPLQPPRYLKAEWLAYPERDSGLPADDVIAGGQAYATSKLCNVLCAYEFARRLEARRITVNAFDPGLVAGTGLGRQEKALMRFAWYYLLPFISRSLGFGRTPQQAGADLAYLASAPELTGVTGKYFSGRKMIASSAESYDPGKAADLWQTSLILSRLKPAETSLLKQVEMEQP